MSVSLGARDQVLRQVDLLGLSNIIVRTDPETSRTGRGLAFRDVSRLRQLLLRAEVVTPLVNRYAQIQGPVRTRGATVVGVEAVHAPLMRLVTGRGRFLSTIDDDANRRVCVLGAGLTQSVFGHQDPIGERDPGGRPILSSHRSARATVKCDNRAWDPLRPEISTRRSWCHWRSCSE